MTRKIQTFTGIITNPMNIHNFALSIPGFEDYSITVQSTSFPSDSLRQTRLYVAGEEIRYPTVAQNSGTWQFVVPETDDGTISSILDGIRSEIWNRLTGGLTVDPTQWRDIGVIARDLNSNESFEVILHGAWLAGRGDVQLNQATPETNWQWQYQFIYQWLENKNLRGL